MSDQKTYITNRVLRHDGKKYDTGADIELNKHFADPLLAVGAIHEKTVKIDGDAQLPDSDNDQDKNPDNGNSVNQEKADKPPVSLDDKATDKLGDPEQVSKKADESKADKPKDSTAKPAFDEITVEQIKERLTAGNIDFTGKSKKQELYDLLPAKG